MALFVLESSHRLSKLHLATSSVLDRIHSLKTAFVVIYGSLSYAGIDLQHVPLDPVGISRGPHVHYQRYGRV